jgi:hypothetical protein
MKEMGSSTFYTKPFQAYLETPKGCVVEQFDSYFEAQELACIRQENLGVNQRSRIKVGRGGVVLWESPERKELPNRSQLQICLPIRSSLLH